MVALAQKTEQKRNEKVQECHQQLGKLEDSKKSRMIESRGLEPTK
jgi:hypothetical protein